MQKKFIPIIFAVLLLLYWLTGCDGIKLDPKNPVTITMWHNYGGQMQSAMDELIDEFNSSIGRI